MCEPEKVLCQSPKARGPGIGTVATVVAVVLGTPVVAAIVAAVAAVAHSVLVAAVVVVYSAIALGLAALARLLWPAPRPAEVHVKSAEVHVKALPAARLAIGAPKVIPGTVVDAVPEAAAWPWRH